MAVRSEIQKYPITEKQMQFYQKNGYVQIDDLLTPDEIQELRSLTDEMNDTIQQDLPPVEERGAYQQVFLQVVNVWQRDERFKNFTMSPRLANVARQLIGCDRVRLWHDHLMTKMPGKTGRATDWHQDFPYWPMNEPGPMSIWIPMQDVDWENGCMHFVPGSQDWNLKEVIYLDRPDEKQDLFEQVKDRDSLDMQRAYVPLKAGSVTFHNGLTFHFAGKNYSESPRRVLSIIYMPDGETYNGASHQVSDGEGLEIGKPFSGEKFPLLPDF